ncbi:MAG: hypothetical protein IIB46_01390, partial [Nitrospinae bacterium]|nr:hypothetical protein [Nitrospinota bacterium]
ASTASAARTALGLAIGSDVQAWNTFLNDIAGFSNSGDDKFMMIPEISGAITTIGIGTGLLISGGEIVTSAALQDLSNVGVVSAADRFLVSSAAGVLTYETATQVRTTLGLVIGTNVLAYDTLVQVLTDLANASGSSPYTMIRQGTTSFGSKGGNFHTQGSLGASNTVFTLTE